MTIAAVLLAATALMPGNVRYECRDYAVKTSQACHPAARAMFGAAEAHQLGSHFGPTVEELAVMRRGLTAAMAVAPESLPQAHRIAVQSAALRVLAHACQAAKVEGADEIAKDARKLVARLALPAATRPAVAVDSIPADAERVLGPSKYWATLAFHREILLHEQAYQESRLFRTALVGKRHAIFSQLVAVDDRGEPYLTDVVDDIEIRDEAPSKAVACIVSREERCELTPFGGKSHVGGFVVIKDGQANCVMCHGTGDGAGSGLIGVVAGAKAEEARMKDEARRAATLKTFMGTVKQRLLSCPKS